MTTIANTDPFTVTRTPAGVAITSAGGDAASGSTAFSYTLSTRHDVDRFLDYLQNPTSDLNRDDWLGTLHVDGQTPVEPRIGSVLYLDQPEDDPTPTARMTILFWPSYAASHHYLDLDLAMAARLRNAVADLMAELPMRWAAPGNNVNPFERYRDTIHRHNTWGTCLPTCYADRRAEQVPPF